MLKQLSIIICLFWSGFLLSQNDFIIDSLLKEIQSNKPTEKLAERALTLQYDKIVNNLNKSLFIFESISDNKIFEKDLIKFGDIKEMLALVYYLKGNYKGSVDLHQQSIVLFEKAGDQRRKANAIAKLAYEGKKRNLKSSIEMMAEAIAILKRLNALSDLASATDNYGVLFEIKGDLDTAMHYYNEALSFKISIHDSIGIPYSLNNIAGIYFMKGNINEGLKYMNRSTEIRERLKDYIGMAWNEYALGELYMSLNNPALAKEHFQRSLTYAQRASYPDLKSRNFKYMAELLAKQNKFDSAYYYFNSFYSIHDSLYNDQTQKQLLEMETLYESEKKSSQIKILDSDNQLKGKELEKKRNTQTFLLFILGISVLAGILIFRAYRQKNAAGKIISLQKIEVEHQKSLIEEKQKEIVDSINYAKRIQYTLLAHEDLLNKHLPNHFVLFKPKDIVSGDFYWATSVPRKQLAEGNSILPTANSELFYLAVCDSTGHGVPGAFMSLLNIGFLSEAIKEKNILQPHDVFNYVRKRLIESISKEEQQDGMDGILICIDKVQNKLFYVAAHNAPILIRDNKVMELAKDKMPVGKGENLNSFTLHAIEFQEGDTLYLYTDGYADQFGGPKGKKFKYKQLNELLLENSKLSLKQQSSNLYDVFDQWKGNLEQVDDVCIIGIRF